MSRLLLIITGAAGAILVLLTAVLLSMYSVLIQYTIKKELVLKDGSDLYSKWAKTDVPITTKFYLFEVQNPEEVEFNGSHPVLKERGPYTFIQKRWKEIIGFEDRSRLLSYKEYKTYHFSREKSIGGLEDEIIALNIPVVASVEGAIKESETSDLGPAIIEVINALIKELEEPLFELKSLHELLFTGYRVAILDRMAELAKEFGWEIPENLPNNTFGLMVGKNGSDSGIMTIHSGVDDTPIFQVHSWEMAKTLTYWNGTFCNMINGTDASGFGPGIKRDTILYAFQPDFCRSAQIVYKEDSEVHGIKTYRYILGDDNFRAPLSSPETSCFCTQREPRRDICEMNGILDVSSCSDGAPIALSPAHFLDGDTHLTEDVFGLRPSPEKHEMYLDIEPLTGTILYAARRLQVNVMIKNYPQFEIVSKVRNVILPIFWIEETAGIDEKMAGEMNQKVFSRVILGKTILRSLLFAGLFVVIISAAIAILVIPKKTTPVSTADRQNTPRVMRVH